MPDVSRLPGRLPILNSLRELLLSLWRRRAATVPVPSRRAQLYALMAHLTDEDGALVELEDLG